MVIVAVAAGAAILTIVSSSVTSADSTNEANRILEDLKIVQVTVGEDKTTRIFVINRGSVDSKVDRFYIKDYDGNLVAVIPVNQTVKVNEIKDCIVDAAGMDVWSWYEITGVTERGNKILSKVSGNPFTNDALPPPGPNAHEYVFRVSNITVNGVPVTDQSVFTSLLAIDNDTYAIPSKELGFLGYNDSMAVVYYDLQGETLEGPKFAGIEALSAYNDGNYLHVVTNNLPDSSLSSTIFNGTVQNPNYDRLLLNFSFSLQNGQFPVNCTVEFFNWETGDYSRPGSNGYWERLNMDNSNYSGSYNFSIPMKLESIVSDGGNWSLRINITAGTKGNINIKYDYLALVLKNKYSNGIETLLYYNVSQHVKDPANVTKMIFSVTGIFPDSFWFDAFNYSHAAPAEKHWEILGVIEGSGSSKTWIFTVSGTECSDFIDNTGIVITRMLPVDDLPSGTVIQLDQAKLLITVKE